MIPLPHDASQADIEQWCSRGVVMVNTDTGWIPAFFQAVTPNRSIGVNPLDGRPPMAVSANVVSVHWPRCGSVNIPGQHFAVHAARQTQRQYRRTWHATGLSVVTPRAWDVAKFLDLVPGMMRVSPTDLARACFLGVYPSIAEADAMITAETHISVAITPKLIMAGDAGGKRMFYYDGQLAATASDGVLHPVGDDVPVRRIAKLLDGRYHAAPNY